MFMAQGRANLLPIAGEGGPARPGRMRVLAGPLAFADHSFMIRRFSGHQLAQARRLHREMTLAETILWRGLRDRGIGAKFRRQVPVGRYAADFLCISALMIIELDGPPHDEPEQRVHDMHRDEWLRARGWQVLRFSNDLVTGGGNIILEEIQRALNAAESPSSGPR